MVTGVHFASNTDKTLGILAYHATNKHQQQHVEWSCTCFSISGGCVNTISSCIVSLQIVAAGTVAECQSPNDKCNDCASCIHLKAVTVATVTCTLYTELTLCGFKHTASTLIVQPRNTPEEINTQSYEITSSDSFSCNTHFCTSMSYTAALP